MFRTLKRILLLTPLILLLAGCHESYPALYMEEMAESGINAENSETSRVPIVPSLSDPQYEIYTRGHGPFNSFGQDMDHWLSADFHTYALLTANRFTEAAGQQVNYTATGEEHRLLWNQTMRLKDGEGSVAFFDGQTEVSKHYSTQHQDWRYNFFTFYADDCALEPAVADGASNTVTVGLTIDGTQDVMHATAYHNDQDYMQAISKLQQMDQLGDDAYNLQNSENKPIYEYGHELLYSTIAGHRAIQPIFRLNHLLTQLNFYIRGAKASQEDSATPSQSIDASGESTPGAETPAPPSVEGFQQMVVRNVSVEVPTHGQLTVAKDAWVDASAYEQDLQNCQVLRFDGGQKALEPEMKKVLPTDFYANLENDPLYQERYAGVDKMYHITSTKVDTLTRPILVPPSDKYVVKLEVDFLDIPSQESTPREIKSIGPIEYNIQIKDRVFEPGHAYSIIISVYGPQIVEGQVHMKAWVGGDDAGAFVGKDVMDLDRDVLENQSNVFVGGDDDPFNQGAEDQFGM